MSEIFKVIFQLEAESKSVIDEITKVANAYQKVNVELKAQEAELNALLKKEAEILAARKKTNSPSESAKFTNQLKANKAAIDATKKSITDLTAAEKGVGKEAETVGKKLDTAFKGTNVKALSDELKKLGGTADNTAKDAADGFDKYGKLVRDANGEIIASRGNLIIMKKALANATDPKDIVHLAEEVGHLKHELDLASEAGAAFASGNKFKATGIIFEEIGHDIASFNFAGAESKAKLLSEIAGKISFKDVVKGAKQLGGTLVEVGKALLTNPLFLLAAVLVAAFEAMESFSEAAEKNTERIKENEEAINNLVRGIEKLNAENEKAALDYEKNAGKIAKVDAESKKNSIDHQQEMLDIDEKYAELRKKAKEQAEKDADEKGFFASKLDLIKGAMGEETDIQVRTKDFLKNLDIQQNEELNAIDTKYKIKGREILVSDLNERIAKVKKAKEDELKLRQDFTKLLVDADKANTEFFNKERAKQGSNEQIKLEFDAKRNAAKEEFRAREEEINAQIIQAKKEGTLTKELAKNFAKDRILIQEKLTQDFIQLNQEQQLALINNNQVVSQEAIETEKQKNEDLLAISEDSEIGIARQRLLVQQDYYSKTLALAQKDIDARKALGFDTTKQEAALSALKLKANADNIASINALNAQETDLALKQNDLAESQAKTQLELKNKTNSQLLFSDLDYEKAKLEILKQGGDKYAEEAKKQADRVTLLEKEATKQRRLEAISYYEQISQAAISTANKLIDVKLKEVDAQTSLQQKRVDAAKDIAQDGNAELLQEEKNRLEKLNKEKEKFVRQQQALATIEIISNTAIAVSKAAAEGGVAAGITIAIALLALVAGLASARSIASQAAFYEGGAYEGEGYTGSGNPREQSSKVGAKPYIYHKDEFIFNHKNTRKYKDIFQGVHEGRIDLREWADKVKGFDSYRTDRETTSRSPIIHTTVEIGELRDQMATLISIVAGQQSDVSIDENGFSVRMKKVIARNEFIKNLAT